MTSQNESKQIMTWEDILPINLGEHGTVELCADYLKQAEADGLVCINPPTELEIRRLLFPPGYNLMSWTDYGNEVSEAISARIKNGE